MERYSFEQAEDEAYKIRDNALQLKASRNEKGEPDRHDYEESERLLEKEIEQQRIVDNEKEEEIRRRLKNSADNETEIEKIPDDNNIRALKYLDAKTRESAESNIAARKQIIDALLEECGEDPSKVFQEIFGVPSSQLEMIKKPYGLYFHGNETAFKKVYSKYNTFFIGGIGGLTYLDFDKDLAPLKRDKFIGMVGFGEMGSSGHELTHMFNSALPMHEIYEKYKDINNEFQNAKDEKGAREITERQYELWANSRLKDEILARIDNNQILEAKEETPDNPYTSGTRIFKSYEPDKHGYDFVHPEDEDDESFSPENIKIWEQYQMNVVDPVRNLWIERYNQNIRAIKRAIENGVEKAKVKAIIIQNPFENIAGELEKYE